MVALRLLLAAFLAAPFLVGCAATAPVKTAAVQSAIASAPAAATQTQARRSSEPTELFTGIAYRREARGEGEAAMVAHIVELDLARARIGFGVTPADPSRGMEHTAQLTSAFLEASRALLAVNASYFLPFAGGSPGGDDYYPLAGDPVSVSGAALSGGAVVSPIETDLDIRVNAMVCFTQRQIAIADGQTCSAGVTDGVAAGPRLLAQGARRSFAAFDNRYASTAQPRTALGVSADGKRAWLIVVDGRQSGYSVGATLEEVADLFLDLGAYDAINLDGGGSSTLAARGPDGKAILLNRPIHTGVPGRERPVANHIGVFPAAQ